MHNKYVRELEEKEKINREKVEKLEGEIRDLRLKLEQLQKDSSRITHLENAITAQRHRLLIGTLSYTYVESAVEFVFSNKDGKKLRMLKAGIHSIDELEEEASETEETKERFATFQSAFYKEEYAESLKKMAKVSIAHLTTKSNEDEAALTPKRMQDIIGNIYKQRDNKHHRETACSIVDSLDQLRRALQKMN